MSLSKLAFTCLVDSGLNKTQYSDELLGWIQSAEAGNADAQALLGLYYFNGIGVERDYNQAVVWLTKAAQQGNVHAQVLLGNCYLNGWGITQDYKQAITWLTKAANQGNAEAQYSLGLWYFEGTLVERDYNQAVVWLTKAAQQNITVAQTILGGWYFEGKYIERDYNQAVVWLTKAAQQGITVAQALLGSCYFYGYGVEQDHKQAITWCTKAAQQGDATTQNFLGDYYFFGIDVAQDYKQAITWYTKAANQGNVKAQKMLNILRETIKNKGLLPTSRTEVFISYSRNDAKYVEEMEPFLKSLTRDNNIPIWFYQKLRAGEKWKEEIREHMSAARVAILLVSQDFLASDFVYEVELPDLLQAATDVLVTILWIPVGHSRVKNTRIKTKDGKEICINDYQAVCDPLKPLQSMSVTERNKIYLKICEEIERYFDNR